MAAELRWILFGLSVVLLAGIWWWGRRRSSQAPGNALLREITPTLEPLRHEPPGGVSPVASVTAPRVSERGVPPLEPLSIHTQEYDAVPIVDGPMLIEAHSPPVLAPPSAAPESVPRGAAPARQPAEAASERAPRGNEQQKIITLRVCAPGDMRWSGATLLSALESQDLAYGRYQVFHRTHVDGRSLFCVASLIEPGTFDVEHMASEEFRGVTLFAVLPGPVEPLLTVDELLGAARGLAQDLTGMVQDSQGMPLSPQRAGALRDDVARFQASLHRA